MKDDSPRPPSRSAAWPGLMSGDGGGNDLEERHMLGSSWSEKLCGAAVFQARPRNEAATEGVEPPTCFSSLGRGGCSRVRVSLLQPAKVKACDTTACSESPNTRNWPNAHDMKLSCCVHVVPNFEQRQATATVLKPQAHVASTRIVLH